MRAPRVGTDFSQLDHLPEGQPLVGKTPDGFIAVSRERHSWSFIRIRVRLLGFNKVVDSASELSIEQVRTELAQAQAALLDEDRSVAVWFNSFF